MELHCVLDDCPVQHYEQLPPEIISRLTPSSLDSKGDSVKGMFVLCLMHFDFAIMHGVLDVQRPPDFSLFASNNNWPSRPLLGVCKITQGSPHVTRPAHVI